VGPNEDFATINGADVSTDLIDRHGLLELVLQSPLEAPTSALT